VLCPQMSEAQIEIAMSLIEARWGSAAIERSAITVAQLCEMAPLALDWDDDRAAPGAAPAPPTVIAGQGSPS
jgi:hypothetical protein